MANYSMTCTCGDEMSIESSSREAAVAQFKAMMDEKGIEQHFAEHHKPGEQRPTVEQTHAMVDQMVAAR